ncbi:MAG TPA: hypothetical protein VN493_11290 [Thermoanaerobaculia bacterium]|nr:hypothetical protein [Thermoanaerobaculia bacterium]
MDLPRALAHWAPHLGIFPRDLAVSLGPVLHRLSFAVGPLQVRRHQADGEPDGYDGLSRRGSYERLLTSEWLLAEEAPEEFVRRAAMGEHLFLHVARPVPAGSRVSAAVFDAGPGQLGSPRIAQIAALIVLARRAEAAGVRFAWGILQEPEAPLFEKVTEAGILRLLQARTPFEATDAQLTAWHRRLQGWREVDDLWFVGQPRLATVPGTRGASFLQVWDVLDPETRRVAIKVRRGTGSGGSGGSGGIGGGVPSPTINLELPDHAACARLLRDPFSATAVAPDRLAAPLVPASDLLFAANGSKLFARAAGGGVVAFPVPNSPRAPSGAPRLYDPWPGQLPAAVGLAQGQVILATSLPDGGAALSYASKKRGGGGTPGVAFAPGEAPFQAGGAGSPLHPLFQVGLHTYLLDAEGTLFRAWDGDLLRLASRVSAAAFVAGHLAFVEAATPGCPARLTSAIGGGAPRTIQVLEEAEEGAPAFFGFGGRLAHPEHGLVAVAQRGGAWEIYGRGRTWLVPFEGTRVLGVARDRERNEAGLLLLEEDSRTLLLAGLHWTRKLPTGSAEIRHAAACPGAPWIAWVTVHGELTVYSMDHDAVLLRRVPGHEPSHEETES